jgi:hypothetical protein
MGGRMQLTQSNGVLEEKMPKKGLLRLRRSHKVTGGEYCGEDYSGGGTLEEGEFHQKGLAWKMSMWAQSQRCDDEECDSRTKTWW